MAGWAALVALWLGLALGSFGLVFFGLKHHQTEPPPVEMIAEQLDAASPSYVADGSGGWAVRGEQPEQPEAKQEPP